MRDEIVGMKFGRLEVVSYAGKSANYMELFRCKCDCGAEKTVRGQSLLSGAISSCGCLRKESVAKALTKHGHARDGAKSRTYATWQGMVQRCNNGLCRGWINYGGRGVRVCERWMKFENFLEDMGEQPEGLTIERNDTNGNYEPSNCRWATYAEQNRNYSRNHRLSFRGETMCLADWTSRLGMKRGTISARLKRGWTVEMALTKPVSM